MSGKYVMRKSTTENRVNADVWQAACEIGLFTGIQA
jgi:hypothetical protein